MVDASPGEHVLGGVERARGGVAHGEEVDQADVRALERSRAARGDERDEAEAAHLREHGLEQVGLGLGGDAALLGLIRGLERDAGDLGEPHLRADDDDALVEVVPIERAAGVAELAIIGAHQQAERAALPVAAEGDERLVSAGGQAIGPQLPRRVELAVGREAAGEPRGEVDVGAALAGEGAELGAADEALVLGDVLVDLALDLALALGHVVELAVEDALDAGAVADRPGVGQLEAADELLAIEDRDLGGAELIVGRRPQDGLAIVRIGRLIEAGVELELGAGLEGVADAAADGVEVVERPEVEQVDVVAAVHARTCPKGQALDAGVADLEVEVADRQRGGKLAVVVEDRGGEGGGGDDPRVGAGRLPVVLAPQLELGVLASSSREPRATMSPLRPARPPASPPAMTRPYEPKWKPSARPGGLFGSCGCGPRAAGLAGLGSGSGTGASGGFSAVGAGSAASAGTASGAGSTGTELSSEPGPEPGSLGAGVTGGVEAVGCEVVGGAAGL
ncbi:hypothetical protein OV079_17600 [Nannocystis pusilla]|uniref:Uncharacterized protein n=1 Tax=Nannocystis pusilla TaxID=889268 RepID=A0A9X3IY93_9BACT|nr:hypothetical protein [Nannocystis pusilla]MCY1007334.1 hypothetical protein [Nannocystis pusilla]